MEQHARQADQLLLSRHGASLLIQDPSIHHIQGLAAFSQPDHLSAVHIGPEQLQFAVHYQWATVRLVGQSGYQWVLRVQSPPSQEQPEQVWGRFLLVPGQDTGPYRLGQVHLPLRGVYSQLNGQGYTVVIRRICCSLRPKSEGRKLIPLRDQV